MNDLDAFLEVFGSGAPSTVRESTRVSDSVRRRDERLMREARYARAEQRSHFTHALLPRAVEASMEKHPDPQEIIFGLADDVTSLPGRALAGLVGKSAEGYATAANSALGTDFPEHFPSTDMANPESIGHDNASFLTFWGSPAVIGSRAALKWAPKVLPKAYKTAARAYEAGNAAKTQRLAVDAVRKSAEYGADFGFGWMANKPFGSHEVSAEDAALGTAVGAGIDFPGLVSRHTGSKSGGRKDMFWEFVAHQSTAALERTPRATAQSAARALGKDAAQDFGARSMEWLLSPDWPE